MGSHLSPFRGPGAEHDESRIYVPGDDPRHMDWRVTARTARAHVKVYRDERERPLWLIVDQGLSMRFGTRVAFKSVIAARAAPTGWPGSSMVIESEVLSSTSNPATSKYQRLANADCCLCCAH